MHAIFEDAGKFNAGKILSETDSNAQIELDSGKRVKVKLAQVLLRFDKPAPSELMSLGKKTVLDMDLEMAYEIASSEEFGFQGRILAFVLSLHELLEGSHFFVETV
jgi:exoribonuclease-2